MQAAELARALSARAFDVAVASDLARARETAAIVLGARASILAVDARWREMSFGAWEGLTREEILARAGARAATAPRFMTPDGGESFEHVCRRVEAALESVARRTPKAGRALVATHAGPLHAALRLLLGEREATELAVKFLPASYTSFAVGPGRPRLLVLNRTPWESAPAGNGGGSG